MREKMTFGGKTWVRTTLISEGKVVTPLESFTGQFVTVIEGNGGFGGRLVGVRGDDLVLKYPSGSPFAGEEVRFPLGRVESCFFDGKERKMNCIDLFRHLFGDDKGYVCLMYKKGMGDSPAQSFFRWPDGAKDILVWVDEHWLGNCYFCPHLLSKPIRRKDYALAGKVLYADLDACAPERLGKFGEPPPSVVVRTSPGRWQAYWILEYDIEPKEYEALNRRIAIGYKNEGCDQGGWDLTQLLRVPGTTHNKAEPFVVEIIGEMTGSVPAEGFDSLPEAETAEAKPVETRAEDPPVRLTQDELRRWEEPTEDRSTKVFWMVRTLQRHGMTDAGIVSYMTGHPLVRGKYAGRKAEEIGRILAKPREGIDTGTPGQAAEKEYRPPTLDELAASSSEKVAAIAEGLLYAGDLLLIFAGAGVGKSTRTENMAAQLASGNAVYGAFPVGRPHKVMLWELENPTYEVVERMRMLRQAYPFGENLRVDAFPSLDLCRPENRQMLRSGVEDFRPDVLIIEPLGSMHTRDENSATEMREVLTPLKELAAEFGMAVVLCHHKGWGTEGVTHKRPRGSTAILDIVTTAIEVEDMGECLSRLTFAKSRSIGRTPVQELELCYDPETHTLSLADAREYRKLEAVFVIANLRKRGFTLQAIADAVGVNKSTVSRWARGEATPTDEYIQKLKKLHEA